MCEWASLLICSVPVVDAALAAGVSQIVFSTLPDTFELSNGKYDVPHFTAKAKVENYIRYRVMIAIAIAIAIGLYWIGLE